MTVTTETVLERIIACPMDLWARVVRFRGRHRIASDAEAVRRLVARGLAFEAARDALLHADLVFRRLDELGALPTDADLSRALLYYTEARAAAAQVISQIADEEGRAAAEPSGPMAAEPPF